ncbi:ABC transporter ATP-binding protein [Paenibacillus sp. TRM 82003]|nr:ABC transporter ATP-binding protein [Paenibacillus sp. TRM 82003]
MSLTGPSGSGKSTLLHIIAGIVRPTSGEVEMLGRKVTSLNERQADAFRASHIGYVFQSFHLLPGYSALENVRIGMQFAGAVPKSERARRAAALLERVGLSKRMHNRPHQLSNGEQQRVAIARALANRPSLVLADEPTASLDAEHGAKVIELLFDICDENRAALLLCTHDADIAAMTSRSVRLRGGVLQQASIREVGEHVAL